MVKKLLLILSLLAPAVLADQVSSFKFRGVNLNENATTIDPSDSQDALNVDVQPGGMSVTKRDGYGLYKALATAKPVHGGHHLFDSTGNDVQIWGSSTSLYGITADATPVQLISSATLNSIWDCTDTQGSAYCVNSNRNAFVKTDGATMTWYASPLGTMVETTPTRVIVAGVSGTPNTLYVSQDGTFTNFTTGLLTADPFTKVIASPGSKLTHTRSGCGKFLWWKDQSFGSMDFDDQYNVQIKILSDTIGTFDNTSAIDPGGNVWFRGQDGHTYKYDCSFITKESVDITPAVQVSGKRVSNSWTQTTASDFSSGSGYTTFTDTTSVSGAVQLISYQELFSSLSNWSQNFSAWSVSGGVFNCVGTGGCSGALCVCSVLNSSSTADGYSRLVNGISKGFLMHASFAFLSDTGTGVPSCLFSLLNEHSGNPFQGYGMKYEGGSLHTLYAGRVNNDSITGDYNSQLTITDSDYHTMDLIYSATGYAQLYFDGTRKGSFQDASYSGYDVPRITCTNDGSGTSRPAINSFAVTATTGVYYSAVHNAPNLTSWSTLEGASTNNGGTQSFYSRSSTNSFTVTSSTPAWTAQTAGSLIAISTGTYFQFADSFTVTAATQSPILNDFTFNWFEGSSSDQAYMEYFDNAILESVAYGAGQTTNNYIFKRDLINDAWTLYNFGTGGMLIQSGALYFGDTAAGNIFNYGTATSDNGTAINAYWKSKDFTGADPFLQTQLSQIDSFWKKDSGTTITGTYITNGLTSTSYSIILSTGATIAQSRKTLPAGKTGYTFNVQFGDTSTSSAWELFGWRISFIQLPYRPGNP